MNLQLLRARGSIPSLPGSEYIVSSTVSLPMRSLVAFFVVLEFKGYSLDLLSISSHAPRVMCVTSDIWRRCEAGEWFGGGGRRRHNYLAPSQEQRAPTLAR